MESKSFLFTTIPLIAIIVIFSYLNIQQESNSNIQGINESQSNSICKSIEYNGNDRIDILFISSLEDAEHYTEVLLNSEPYKQYRNYFNTRVIENTEVECKDYQGKAILCNTEGVQDLAKQCPHDYVVVIKEKPLNIRSSAYGNIMSINKVHADSVLIHEFGHAFGNLAEEYGGAKIPSGSKNCKSSCNKFTSPIDLCEQECSQSNYYRSIPVGVMRTLVTSNYGIFNAELITKLLEKNKPKDAVATGSVIEDQESQCNGPLVQVEIIQTDEETKVYTDNILREGCTPKEFGEGNLCLGEDNCYSSTFFTDSQNIEIQETIEGETFIPEEPLIIFIPQNTEDQEVQITLDSILIETINTAKAGATACKF